MYYHTLLPNPDLLILKVNGKNYIGQIGIPLGNVPKHDADILSANGWEIIPTLSASTVPNIGITNGSSASAGIVGEYIESSLAQSANVVLTTDTVSNITSITLTPGEWDVRGTVLSNPLTLITVTNFLGGISKFSRSCSGDKNKLCC